ncbi:PaaI family thioesterase [Puniceibacterium sp. IMCC21224]|uniref:PaaI family thioesterase n=1 Tax=Puniceibacterium sp. IMCC21224 TaxID=1618204 RepID=UPI00064D8418|nr:PaaI family thioesterase [Puniceibacterium sp. IMCC21224]KMK64693.1 hypothetical protein IMCC21224_13228 [Puniceibacterium sp. IMCC21224]
MSELTKKQAHLAHMVFAAPAPKRLGIEPVSIEKDTVSARLPYNTANCTLGEVMHGGAIATLVDVVGVAAAIFGLPHVPSTGGTATLTINYLAPAMGCDLTAKATILKGGRRQCVSRVSVVSPKGKLVAEAHVTVVFA